jgi:hypothetical protein
LAHRDLRDHFAHHLETSAMVKSGLRRTGVAIDDGWSASRLAASHTPGVRRAGAFHRTVPIAR